MILLAQEAKLLEIGSVHAQVDLRALQDFAAWSLL
jgi:hypothetical protein